ncbi:hypothetical protein ACTFR8_24410 [Bacillus cereus group sp. MYBK15-3]|uniref:hypothetical protein n=1 Tax=unclassified Bacillus cereus group TaxID=2750818 RepID=UPI003F7B2597
MENENLDILIEDIRTKWNPERFGIVRYPHPVAVVRDRESFGQKIRSVLDMPIKLPNSDVRIPRDLQTPGIIEVVNTCLEFEKGINPNWEDYYLYLTVHHSPVKKASTQRRAGAHIDGMQGERYPDKLPVCHSYVVSNAIPTRFYHHPFQTNLCEMTQNWFCEFDKVKDKKRSVLAKPFEINLMTAYSVHESTATSKDVLRTFVRLEFSLKKFDRKGNSVNPLFDLDWNYQEREIPKHLAQGIFD